MTEREWLSLLFASAGAFFYAAGTVGLLRFPDVYARLHALTKADNTGLGLVVAALVIQTDVWSGAKLVAIWLLALLASATNAHLVARAALRSGVRPWSAP